MIPEEFNELRTHYEVKRKLANLDRWRPVVAVGFIGFWFVWGVALIAAIWHVIVSHL